MPWLIREGLVVAAVEIAADRRSRRRGLLGRSGIEGALLLDRARSVHTLAMRFPIDVAYCVERASDSNERGACSTGAGGVGAADASACAGATVLEVVSTTTMPPWRLGRPRFRRCAVLEAEAGKFARWGLTTGDVVEIR